MLVDGCIFVVGFFPGPNVQSLIQLTNFSRLYGELMNFATFPQGEHSSLQELFHIKKIICAYIAI